jgi:hypothetical protein
MQTCTGTDRQTPSRRRASTPHRPRRQQYAHARQRSDNAAWVVRRTPIDSSAATDPDAPLAAEPVHAVGVLDAVVVLGRREQADHVRAAQDQRLLVPPRLDHEATLCRDVLLDNREQRGEVDLFRLREKRLEAAARVLELPPRSLRLALLALVAGGGEMMERANKLTADAEHALERPRGGEVLAPLELAFRLPERGADPHLGRPPIVHGGQCRVVAPWST